MQQHIHHVNWQLSTLTQVWKQPSGVIVAAAYCSIQAWLPDSLPCTLSMQQQQQQQALPLCPRTPPSLQYFFEDVAGEIKPSVLHGDLWSGNIAGVEGQPAIFDPATYYGEPQAARTACS